MEAIKIFISYSRAEADAADTLAADLEANGFEVVIDRRNLPFGEEWQSELAELIHGSDTIVWLVSLRSLASKWCKWELGEVSGLNKRLIPVRIEDFPLDQLPEALGKIHILPAEGIYERTLHLVTLVETLQTNHRWIKDHTRLMERSRAWLAAGGGRDGLLRGAELAAAQRWRDQQPPNAPNPSPSTLDLILQSSRAAANRARAWVVGLLIVAAITVGLAAVAFYQQRKAQRQATLATSANLSSQSLSIMQRELDLASLLAVQAESIYSGFEARNSLLRLLQFNPRLLTYLRGDRDWVADVAFDTSGKLLASCGAGGKIIIWSLDNFKIVDEILFEGSGTITQVAWSPDGRLLAVGDRDNRRVVLWSFEKRSQIAVLPATVGSIVDLEFTRDGERLIWASEYGNVGIWHLKTSERLGPREGVSSGARALTLSPDENELLALGSSDVFQWDLTKPPFERTRHKLSKGGDDVAFGPDGKVAVMIPNFNPGLVLWDNEQKKEITVLSRDGMRFSSVDVAKRSRLIAAGDYTGRIAFWDWDTRKPIGDILPGHRNRVMSVSFSPDGRMLASCDRSGIILLWDVSTWRPKFNRVFRPGLAEVLAEQIFVQYVEDVAFGRNGRLMASVGDFGKIQLWDMNSRKVILKPRPFLQGSHPRRVAINPDGESMAIGAGGKVILWSIADNKEIARWELGTDRTRSLKFDPSGKRIAAAVSDKIHLIDVISKKAIKSPLRVPDKYDEVLSVAFSPDGRQIAARARDGIITLWDVSSKRLIRQTQQKTSGSYGGTPALEVSVAFSPDGMLLASASPREDGSILLLDARTLELIDTLEELHRYMVNTLAFSPNGELLATLDTGNNIVLWDVQTRKPLGRPLRAEVPGNFPGAFGGLAFSPDGRFLVSGSRHLLLWDVQVASWSAKACRIANRNLSNDEWQDFVGSFLPYTETCGTRTD